jgi:hypothetical protein
LYELERLNKQSSYLFTQGYNNVVGKSLQAKDVGGSKGCLESVSTVAGSGSLTVVSRKCGHDAPVMAYLMVCVLFLLMT